MRAQSVTEPDSLALVALYNATNGANWTSNANWLVGPVASWFGVTVSGNRVTNLDLNNNQLNGTLPSPLGDLTNLTFLDLRNNQLNGAIPSALGNLANLQHLALFFNQFSGTIPAELGALSNLEELLLGNNLLSGPIPPELGNLANLTILSVGNNQLSGSIPAELGNLSNLQHFLVNPNQLSGSIPPSLGNLSNLESLWLENNQLSGQLPSELGNLSNLASLLLSINPLSGSLPLSFVNLSQLSIFAFEATDLCEPSDEIFQAWLQSVPSVTSSGVICPIVDPPLAPDSLALVALYNATDGSNWTDNTNWLSGPVETWFGITVTGDRVTQIDLRDNKLLGELPSELGDLTELQSLFLNNNTFGDPNNNQLNGSIPVELGNLLRLQFLFLTGNQLSGPIPRELGNLSNLQRLWLAQNQLSGPIPAELGNLSNLLQLWLPANQLSGAIPPELANLTNLQQLWLYDNQLSGTIPAELGSLSNLQSLLLDYNQLSGQLPSELGNLSNLASLLLSSNPLSGSLPLSFVNLSQLSIFAFEATDLCEPSDEIFQAWLQGVSEVTSTGVVCRSGGVAQQDSLALVALYNTTDGSNWTDNTNWLSGPVETWFGITVTGGGVTSLNLSANQLNGTIPPELGNLAGLQELSLGGNQIGGPIPSEFANLINLQIGLLNDNQFEDLPNLSPLSALTELNVANNRLTFEDIEPNVGVASNAFTYAPQANLGTIRTETRREGESLTFQLQVGGANNLYQWFKDGNPLAGATSDTYSKASVGTDDAGDYILQITNTVATELTLRSEPITVIVQAKPTVTAEHDANPHLDDVVGISATVSGGFQPTTHQLFYRRGGESAYQSTEFTRSGTNYTAAIPAALTTLRGIDYYVVFSDGQSTATFPNTSDPAGSPAHTRIEVDTYEAGLSLPPLTYRLVSVPVELANPVATAVLEDDYGPYNPDQWRLFRWNPARGAYDEGSEIPAGFTPGTAFWLNTRAGLPFDVEGGRSVDGADSASVTLEPGWNQIATPFAFSIAWENVRGSSEAETPVAYDGEYRYGQDILMPWQGYFVYNSTPNPVTLSFPPAEASAAAAKNRGVPAAMLAASYTMQFKAAVPGTVLRDSENYLGFAVGASEGRDRLDFAEAPGIGAHLRVSVVEGEERLAGSFRPEGGEGQSWVVEVALERLAEALPTQKQVQVVLQEQGERPAGFEIYVLDDDLGRRVTVEQGAFTVELSPPQPVRRLRVIVGTAAYVEAVRGEVMVESLEDALLGNYPNPFNPVTRIQYQLSQRRQVELTIFDVLGRRVQVLERGEREAGRHEVAWDGQDRYGRLVASGVYVYRLEAEGFRAVRTMMLMR